MNAMNKAIVALLASVALACGSDDSKSTSLGEGRYAIVTTIFSEDSQTSLLSVTEDPAEPGELDTDRSTEFGGTAALFGQQGKRLFALGTSDAPTITRYRLTDDNELEEDGDAVSLQQYGLTSGFKRPELVPFVSATKAYWLDDSSLQAIVWNPDEMTTDSSFSLELAERDGLGFELGEATARDGLVFATASYWDLATEDDAGFAAVLVIDTEADEVVDVLTDDRCGQVEELMVGSDGTIYIATTTYGASLHVLQRPEGYPEPCVLRIEPGARVIDPDFYVSLVDVAGGHPAGALVQGQSGSAYVLAFHEDLFDGPIDETTELYAPYEAPAWRWWRLDAATFDEGELLDDAPILSGANRVLRAGGREFIANIDFENQRTTLLAPQEDGHLEPGLEMTGFPYGLIALE